MKYGLFLGCTVPARGRHYEIATRKVARQLGMELVDVEDFACCGFPVRFDRETYSLLAARNLSVAEGLGLDICTICSACTGVLTEASKELEEDSPLRGEVNAKLNRPYNGGVKVRHFARILYEDVGVETIQAGVKRNLDGFKMAAYYGCHYLKPSDIYDGFDDPEHPSSLDELIEATGAVSVDYEDKGQCCGGGILAVDEDIALTVAHHTLDCIKASGADAICLICPFCSVMFDDNQGKIEKKFDVTYNIPVLYYPQLLGLAMGLAPRELGLRMNRVKTAKLSARLA